MRGSPGRGSLQYPRWRRLGPPSLGSPGPRSHLTLLPNPDARALQVVRVGARMPPRWPHTHPPPRRKTQPDLGTGAKLRLPASYPEPASLVLGQEKAAPGLGPGPCPTRALSAPQAPRPGHRVSSPGGPQSQVRPCAEPAPVNQSAFPPLRLEGLKFGSRSTLAAPALDSRDGHREWVDAEASSSGLAVPLSNARHPV